MKTIIHVNQHNIKANSKGEAKPVLTIKTYKDNRKGNTANVLSVGGEVIGRFIYSPDKPLSCGAKVWFETDYTVEVI